MAAAARAPHAGQLLREWRERRNLSQFRLASGSAVSARYLSFIETGRARPSREMVLHLADRLEVPLRERNRLLLAAGFAPAYGERSLASDEMTPVRDALERFLAAHEPYPALVLDRRWNLVLANTAITPLLDGIAAELLEPPANALRATLHPDGMAPRILNFDEWSGHLVHRLRREIALTGDAELEALLAELLSYPNVRGEPPPVDAAAAAEIVLPLRLRHGSGRLSFFSTLTTFGTAADVSVAELGIEAFYPADAETAAVLAR
ncbi:MAG: helix-turn-helix transcriptional regulator [Gaiellaceae bacterium MAG52_C11]|nr:helix-turn-helix transcriptional regulator [Candidatus Gaiellasilicea maunaloa]